MLEIAGHIPEICTNLKMLKHMPQISGHTQETLSNLKIFVSFQKKIVNLHVNFLLWKYALNFQGGRYSLSGLLSGKKCLYLSLPYTKVFCLIHLVPMYPIKWKLCGKRLLASYIKHIIGSWLIQNSLVVLSPLTKKSAWQSAEK